MNIDCQRIKFKLDPVILEFCIVIKAKNIFYYYIKAILPLTENQEVDLNMTLEQYDYCKGNASCNNPANLWFVIDDEPFNVINYSTSEHKVKSDNVEEIA